MTTNFRLMRDPILRCWFVLFHILLRSSLRSSRFDKQNKLFDQLLSALLFPVRPIAFGSLSTLERIGNVPVCCASRYVVQFASFRRLLLRIFAVNYIVWSMSV